MLKERRIYYTTIAVCIFLLIISKLVFERIFNLLVFVTIVVALLYPFYVLIRAHGYLKRK